MTHPSTTQPWSLAMPMWLQTPCTHHIPLRCSQIQSQERWTSPKTQIRGKKEKWSMMSSATSERTQRTKRTIWRRKNTSQQTSRTQHPSPSTHGGTLTQRTRTTHWTWTPSHQPQNQTSRSSGSRRRRRQGLRTDPRPPLRSWSPRSRTSPQKERGKRGGRLRKWARILGRKGRFHVAARVEFR